MNYILRSPATGRCLCADTKADLAVQAGARLVGRTLHISIVVYNSYSAAYSLEELNREFGRDAVFLLCKNHGWDFYKKEEVVHGAEVPST